MAVGPNAKTLVDHAAAITGAQDKLRAAMAEVTAAKLAERDKPKPDTGTPA